MLPKYVRVKNKSGIRRTIEDRDLPGGFIRIEPGETTSIPIPTYIRNRRRCGRWIVNVDSPTYKPTETVLEPVVESEPEPETVLEPVVHAPEQAIVCEVCGQVAKSELGLRSHMRKHKIQVGSTSSPQVGSTDSPQEETK